MAAGVRQLGRGWEWTVVLTPRSSLINPEAGPVGFMDERQREVSPLPR